MIEKLKAYLSETRTELRKVTWPTVDELKESTRVVIVATIAITIFIGVVDQLLNRIIQFVLR
jgi:preprotein translocase subunit SecE